VNREDSEELKLNDELHKKSSVTTKTSTTTTSAKMQPQVSVVCKPKVYIVYAVSIEFSLCCNCRVATLRENLENSGN